jgi:hypothetical protein
VRKNSAGRCYSIGSGWFWLVFGWHNRYGTSLRTVVRELQANDVVECSKKDDVRTNNETIVVVVVVVVVLLRRKRDKFVLKKINDILGLYSC